MGESANGRLLHTDPGEPPNYNTAATGLLGPGQGTLVLTQAQAPPETLGRCPQTAGCP